jgi:hypothetical protein
VRAADYGAADADFPPRMLAGPFFDALPTFPTLGTATNREPGSTIPPQIH